MLGKMKLLGFLMTISVCALSTANAETDRHNVVYIGSGVAKNTNTVSKNSNPATLGYLRFSNISDLVWGGCES